MKLHRFGKRVAALLCGVAAAFAAVSASATVRAAEELLQRANDFVEEFLSLGDELKAVFEKYETAQGRLVDGHGSQSIAKSGAKLVRLGVQPRTRGGKTYELASPIAEAL